MQLRNVHYRNTLVLCLLFSQLPMAFSGEPPCESIWQGVGATVQTNSNDTWHTTRYLTGITLKAFLKSSFLPFFLPHDIAQAKRQLKSNDQAPTPRKVAGTVFREDLLYAIAHGLLIALARGTSYSVREYHEDTKAFNQGPNDCVVVVDAFSDSDFWYSGAGHYVFEKQYEHLNHQADGKKHAYLITPTSFEALLISLRQIAKKCGPINKVDYYGHGLPGKLKLEKDSLQYFTSISPINIGMSEAEVIPDLMSRQYHLGPSYMDMRFQDIKDEQVHWKGIFAKDANVRFNSCFFGNGVEGYRVTHHLGSLFFDQGGTIYTSRVQILPNFIEIAALIGDLPKPPEWLRSAGDWISPARAWTTVSPLKVVSGDGSFILERSAIVHFEAKSQPHGVKE